MKLAAPIIPISLDAGTVSKMAYDGEQENVRLYDEVAINCNITALNLSSVTIEKVQFSGSHFGRITIRDVIAKNADFSSVYMDNGMIVRARFTSCRMTGVDFSRTSLHDVVFDGCKLDLANFRYSDLRRVLFINCTFTEADFMNAKMTNVDYQSSVLEKTIFSHATCKHVDLRSSELIDLIGWQDLKGTTIDNEQLVIAAPYLARELGINVQNT